jgi:glycosyltransferase involved in cell wall biosynthesis
VITALSTLRPEKNFEAAIDAIALLRERFEGVRLVIAGSGPHKEAVRRYATRLGDAVVLTGHREDVMELLDASDILIHPSHFDAFPTALLEAMAASVPVVATAVGGMLEIVEADVTGVLVPLPPSAEAFASAIAPLLERPEMRLRLGSAGRQRYEREFAAEPWAHRVRAVYDRVLSARDPRGEGGRA